MKNNFKVLLAATLCSCSLSMVSFAGTWQEEGANWKYQIGDSSYAVNGWVADNGKWYYFDAARGVCTNPNAVQTAEAEAYSQEEQQYIDYIDQFMVDLEGLADKTVNIDSSGAVEQGKQLLNKMKVPFIQFFQLQAPARFTQAHERYKKGCTAMVEYLDICIQIVDSQDLSQDNFCKKVSYFQIMEEEFGAGDELFEAAK